VDPTPTPSRYRPPVSGPPNAESTRPLPIERAAAALEVVLCSGFPTQLIVITILSTFGMRPRLPDGSLSAHFVFALTSIDTVLLVGLIVFFFRAHRESARDVLLGSRPVGREVLVGMLLIPTSFFVVVFVLLAVQALMPSLRNVPHNPLQDLAHTRADAIIFALVVMIAGGVREEIQRAFVLRRFEQYLGGAAIGLAVFSVLFGLGHIEQGYDVALATAVLGAFWGVIYLGRGSILGPMIGHAGFNLAQVLKFVT
jgi:membrane protease YdiL (CAAX protease family)